jgi:hypothetical protein
LARKYVKIKIVNVLVLINKGFTNCKIVDLASCAGIAALAN